MILQIGHITLSKVGTFCYKNNCSSFNFNAGRAETPVGSAFSSKFWFCVLTTFCSSLTASSFLFAFPWFDFAVSIMRHATFTPCESTFEPEDKAGCNLTVPSNRAHQLFAFFHCLLLSSVYFRLTLFSFNNLVSCLSFSCSLFSLCICSACLFFFSPSSSSSCFL